MAPDSSQLSVLWATDGSDESRNAGPMLHTLVLPSASRLIVLNVVPHSFFSGARPDPAFLLKAGAGAKRKALLEGEELAESEATALDPADIEVEAIARWGNPIEEILKAARSRSADMIVLGAKGHSNLGLLLLGSVSQGVVQNATRPVLIARPNAVQSDLGSIVVGYDGSPAARKAVAFLERLELPLDTRLHLVDVIPTAEVPAGTPGNLRRAALEQAQAIREQRHQDASRRLDVLAEHLRSAGLVVDRTIASGEAAPELDSMAKRYNAGLVVVGSRRPEPLRHYLVGSTAEKLVRHAQTSVLVVR